MAKTISTRDEHTTGRPYAHVPARVDITPYFPNTQKKPIFRVFEHSKVYINTLEENLKGTHRVQSRNYSKEAIGIVSEVDPLQD
ncbi:hypothetical protein F383_19784 [Gossypium arboreum]|uniref:Uncharacterized protein n=1 Tax=Gossypium arboreum TaxID=29729 RepID=A0A0B0NV89_GOSAR|nr:hypothetical protein F383_19784 [Gossypium arboreum]